MTHTVATAPPLTVMTVNIHKGFTTFNRKFILPELRDAVRKVGADVVFMQEVLGTHERHRKKVDGLARGAALRIPGRQHLAAVRVWPQRGVSQGPPRQCRDVQVPDRPLPEPRRLASPGPEKRGLLHCVLRVPGHARSTCMRSACTWAWPSRTAMQQLDLLCQIVRGEVPDDAPLIVAGDFNDWRRRAHDILEREVGLQEVFVSAYGEPAKTFPARFPLLSLDRIYVRNASVHLPVVLPRRPWSHLSDHAPLAAEIHL